MFFDILVQYDQRAIGRFTGVRQRQLSSVLGASLDTEVFNYPGRFDLFFSFFIKFSEIILMKGQLYTVDHSISVL